MILDGGAMNRNNTVLYNMAPSNLGWQTINDMTRNHQSCNKYRKGSGCGMETSPDTAAPQRYCCKPE